MIRPGVVTYLLAVFATPALHGLAFPPARRYLWAWVALVPWFAAIRLAGARTALLLSAVVTLTGTYLVAGWLPRAVAVYYGQPVVVGIGLFVAAWCATLAPWFLGFTLCYRAMAARSARTLPLLVGAAWAACELGRVRVLVGDPFGLLGYSQAGVGPLVQIADVTGVYGVSFLVAAVNAALAEVWVAAMRGPRRTAEALAGFALVGAALAGAVGYGRFRLDPRTQRTDPATRVVVAQANLDLGAQWRQDLYGRNLEEYMRLTLQALRESRPALVIWPESAMTFFLEDEPLYRAAIGHLLSPYGAELVAGGPHAVGAPATRYYNSAFLVSPDGRVLARYEKQRLLPFAEYFPFAGVALLRREFARVREFAPGTATGPLPTVAGPAGVVICNEAMFPELVARRVQAGAAFLVNLANDSWLGDPQFSAEALDMARLRAVEQRRYVVRASTSGPSAIIDPFGRIVVQSEAFSRAAIAGAVRPNDIVTPYGRFGDAFAIGCGLTALAVALSGRLTRRTSPR